MVTTLKETNEITKDLHYSNNNLILSIDSNDEIIKFNKNCEKVTGYSKDEVFKNNFIDFLTSNRYLSYWKKIINSIRKKNNLIDDFKLPLFTKNGHEIMISWSSFYIKKINGNVDDISFIGKLVDAWDDSNEFFVGRSKETTIKAENYFKFNEIFRKMEKEILQLENKNKILEINLNKLKNRKNLWPSKEVKKTTLSVFLTGKKKREKYKKILYDLDKRENDLDKLESKINKDKRSFNEQREWFVKWREKLESLELDIDKRFQEIIRHEKIVDNCLKKPSDANVPIKQASKSIEKEHNLIDKISDSAAIIKRGILKQVNDPFANLLEYSINEVIDKSLFDFIDPEGFSSLEEYYLGRLKGENMSIFETVFLTKHNYKISAEVSLKPIIFNNEKAEIAIIKKINKKN